MIFGLNGLMLATAALVTSTCEPAEYVGPSEVTVDIDSPRFQTAPDLWGVFFEDISLSLDGGVYAELVRNRSFEDGGGVDESGRSWSGRTFNTALQHWSPVGHANLWLDTSLPLSPDNRQCGRVEARPGGGVANDGFFGIAVRDGAGYRLSVSLRGEVEGPIEVSLESLGRPAFANAVIPSIDREWKTYAVVLTAKGEDPAARLVFRAPHGGVFFLDCVSLFPMDTYGSSGLFRKDLMERLAALRPSFVRFPGGCWVEGETMQEAYRWKKTLGSPWRRRTQRNLWNYWSANGVGFHEYLLICEELKAKALFCINCGMSHKENVPLDRMDEYVQDALDAIEYANGSVTSRWGAVRAANGHPEPFNLRYLEIGNENGGKAYYERYALIHDAIVERHPEITIISDVWHGMVKGRPAHTVDEHYYETPEWFMSDGAHLYDARPRGKYEVFVGEYAVTKGTGRWGSLRGAIGEAAFMCGLERNADLVKMAAYAPLFANANHTAWSPDLIYVTTDGNFVNPSWNVQKLFSENRGVEVLGVRVATGRFSAGGHSIEKVQASAVRDADGAVIVKLVNCSEEPQPVALNLKGRMQKTLFTGPARDAHNSPTEPEALKEQVTTVDFEGMDTLPPLSLTIFRGCGVK